MFRCVEVAVSDTTVLHHGISSCWYVQLVVKVTCNSLLVIAANGFLLDGIPESPIITLLSLAF